MMIIYSYIHTNAGGMLGMSVAGGGWASNLIVFLITKFNVKSISATKIGNVIFGTNNLLPIAGAFIADSSSDLSPSSPLFPSFLYW